MLEFFSQVINIFLERKDFFFEIFLQHLSICAMSIVIILFLGTILGILMTTSNTVAKIMLNITSFLYTIPSIALFGFFIAITGIGNKTAIIVLVIYGILPMVRNTYVGITEVDPKIIEAAKGMGSNCWQLLFKIELPLAMPVIVTGIRTMVIMVISLTSIASFIGAGGLGVAIYRGINTYNPALTFLGSLMVALLALLADFLIGQIEKKLTSRSKRENL
ncbi:MAG TPA: ABC transporter permease [Candidatus Eisenbacteria bacterium]|nr:ABC transporter permease [Candidatus Eisenbacteria bacterium]